MVVFLSLHVLCCCGVVLVVCCVLLFLLCVYDLFLLVQVGLGVERSRLSFSAAVSEQRRVSFIPSMGAVRY